MTKSKNTKRALIVSALCLLLCVSMLVGTTFAWFTDNASTSVNKIQAGTLDIDIVDKDGNSLDGKTMEFVDMDENDLWEPGCTYKLAEAKLVNKGNLWLKFKLSINGITGKDAALASVIDVYNGDMATGTKLGTLADLIADTDGAAHGELAPAGETGSTSEAYQLTLHMQESAGNAYQGLTLNNISFTVQATQFTKEKDSFDDQYDKNAQYDENVVFAPDATDEEKKEQIKEELTKDQQYISITLTEDMTYDINGIYGLPMGGDSTEVITIDGQGHTITFNGMNSDYSQINTKNGAKLVINNATLAKSGPDNGAWNTHDINFNCPVELNNVTSNTAIALHKDAVLNGVTINDSLKDDVYHLWIAAEGQSVTLNNCTINASASGHRAIAIKEQYVNAPAKVNLSVKGCTISAAKKAAILVTSPAGADISLSNVNITGVVADTTNAVWIDSANPTAPVTVTGGTAIVEP